MTDKRIRRNRPAETQAEAQEDYLSAVPMPAFGDGASFAESLYLAMRESISNGTLPAGTRLRETEVAQRFGVSRTPVREALKKMEAEGLVTDVPGRGITVTKPSLNEILDDYLIREVLEGLAARLAAERALETDILMLRSILRQVVDAHKADDADRAVALSASFDDVLFTAARNPRLHRTIEAVRGAQGNARRGNLWDKVRRSAAIKERFAILEGVAARDAETAAKAAQDHLRNAREYRMAQSLITAST